MIIEIKTLPMKTLALPKQLRLKLKSPSFKKINPFYYKLFFAVLFIIIILVLNLNYLWLLTLPILTSFIYLKRIVDSIGSLDFDDDEFGITFEEIIDDLNY